MDQYIAEQSQVETDLLRILMEGIRSVISWKAEERAVARKLSSLRFVVHSFERHLGRVFTLEECDGYMAFIPLQAPRLSRAVDSLKSEHEEIRTSVRRIAHTLEHITSADEARLAQLCDELLTLLKRLDHHLRKESDIFQEAYEQDRGGGEG